MVQSAGAVNFEPGKKSETPRKSLVPRDRQTGSICARPHSRPRAPFGPTLAFSRTAQERRKTAPGVHHRSPEEIGHVRHAVHFADIRLQRSCIYQQRHDSCYGVCALKLCGSCKPRNDDTGARGQEHRRLKGDCDGVERTGLGMALRKGTTRYQTQQHGAVHFVRIDT